MKVYFTELAKRVEERARQDTRNNGALVWVIDNYEYLTWRRFLAGALGLYQKATESDRTALAAQREAAAGSATCVSGCNCSTGCVGGRCECNGRGHPCDPKTCACTTCHNTVNGLLKAALSRAAIEGVDPQHVDLVLRSGQGTRAGKPLQYDMLQGVMALLGYLWTDEEWDAASRRCAKIQWLQPWHVLPGGARDREDLNVAQSDLFQHFFRLAVRGEALYRRAVRDERIDQLIVVRKRADSR